MAKWRGDPQRGKTCIRMIVALRDVPCRISLGNMLAGMNGHLLCVVLMCILQPSATFSRGATFFAKRSAFELRMVAEPRASFVMGTNRRQFVGGSSLIAGSLLTGSAGQCFAQDESPDGEDAACPDRTAALIAALRAVAVAHAPIPCQLPGLDSFKKIRP